MMRDELYHIIKVRSLGHRAILTFFSNVKLLQLIPNFYRRACFHLDKLLQRIVKERENKEQSKTTNRMATVICDNLTDTVLSTVAVLLRSYFNIPDHATSIKES